jgi:Zn finger protein HypA/HybF involved in hydrogenase expression
MERKTHEQFIEEIAALNPYYSNNEFEIVDKYVNAKTKVRCKCLKCGDFFERRPDHLRRGQGCPKCDNMGTGPTLMTHEAFIKKLLSKNTKYASSEFEIVGKYQGATKEVICHCPLHGNWSTTSSSLLRGAGCPKCANRMTEDVFLEKLLERNEQYSRGEIEITGEYINSKTKIQGRCLVCGHEWEKTPNDLLGNHGCPNYRRHPEWVDPKTPSSEQFLQRLSAMHPNIELLSQFDNMTKPLNCRCKVCGHEWATSGTRLITVGQGCPNWQSHPDYSSPKKKSHSEYVKDLTSRNAAFRAKEFELLSEYDGMDNKIKCRCLLCDREWSRTAYDLLALGSGCPACSSKKRGLEARKTHKQFIAELNERNDFYSSGAFEVLGEYATSKTSIACHCLICGHKWDANQNALLLKGAGCPRCAHSGTSKVEQLICAVLEKYVTDDEVLNRDANAIGMELDIYLPRHQFAIEYGAWFWHKDRLASDLLKIEKCKENGIELITIYDQFDESAPPENPDVIVYPFDLWSEQGQPALRELVSQILLQLGFKQSVDDADWKHIRQQVAKRTVLKSTEDFKKELAEVNEKYASGQFELTGSYIGIHNHIGCKCNICNYEWSPDASSLLGGAGCPSCAGVLKKSQDDVVREIAKYSNDIEVIGEYKGASLPLRFRCKVCGYEWETTTGAIRRGRGCPNYREHPGWVDPTSRTQEQFVNEVSVANPNIEPLGKYIDANTKVLFRCKVCGYEWETKPAVIINLGAGCPKCAGTARKTTEEFVVEARAIHGDKYDYSGVNYQNSKTKVCIACPEHGEFWQTPNSHLRGTGCPVCGRSKKSPNSS